MAKTKDLTVGSPLALIIKFALPLMAGNLFQQAYNIVDAAIVGRYLGAPALAAVGASSSVQFLVLGFCTGTMVGFSIPVAQQFGAHDEKNMRRYIFAADILAFAIAAVMTTVCALLCGNILRVMQTPSDIFHEAWVYLLIIFLGIPFIILYNYLSGILRAMGDSKTPFVFLVISTVLNIFLDLIFIIAFGWGVAGAGAATILSQALSGFTCLIYIHLKYEILRIKKEDSTFEMKYYSTLLGMGLPMGLQFSITAVGSMIMQSVNNALGTVFVSAFSAATKIKQFCIAPFQALSAAVSTFASQNYGAHKFDRIKKGFLQGVATGVTMGVFVGSVLVFFGRPLSMIFISRDFPEILDASKQFLRVAGFFYPFLGLLDLSRMTVQGLGYSNRAIFSGVIEMIARITVSFTLVPLFGWTAICFCDQTAWVCASCFIFPYCIHLIKKISRD